MGINLTMGQTKVPLSLYTHLEELDFFRSCNALPTISEPSRAISRQNRIWHYYRLSYSRDQGFRMSPYLINPNWESIIMLEASNM